MRLAIWDQDIPEKHSIFAMAIYRGTPPPRYLHRVVAAVEALAPDQPLRVQETWASERHPTQPEARQKWLPYHQTADGPDSGESQLQSPSARRGIRKIYPITPAIRAPCSIRHKGLKKSIAGLGIHGEGPCPSNSSTAHRRHWAWSRNAAVAARIADFGARAHYQKLFNDRTADDKAAVEPKVRSSQLIPEPAIRATGRMRHFQKFRSPSRHSDGARQGFCGPMYILRRLLHTSSWMLRGSEPHE